MKKANASSTHLTPLDKPPSPLLSSIRTGKWLNEQEFPELEWIVPGIIPEGCTLLVGPPKAGKSWLALSIAVSVSTGSLALGEIQTGSPRPVLLFALEDSDRRMKDRIRQIQGAMNTAPQMLSYTTHVDPNDLLKTIDQWLYENGSQKPLIILDTLGKAMPPSTANESQYQRDYRVGAQLKATVDGYPGAGLIILHHNRKAETDDFVESVSGTNGLAGSADTIAVLKRDRLEDDGTLSITGRDIEEKELAMQRCDAGWVVTEPVTQSKMMLKDAKRKYGKNKQQILDFIEEEGEVTVQEVIKRFGQNARYLLSQLNKSGDIEKSQRGVYSWPTAS